MGPLAPGASVSLSFEVPVTALGHWDVAHGRWTVEPGAYEIRAGGSSTDVRRMVRVEVAGAAPGPRPVLTEGLAAADYDEQSGTVIVDRTKLSGDAVTPADPGTEGRLVHRACDLSDGVTEAALTVAGEGSVELSLADGTVLARAEVPPTGGPYAYTALGVPLVLRDVVDLHVGLRGPVRLAHIGFAG